MGGTCAVSDLQLHVGMKKGLALVPSPLTIIVGGELNYLSRTAIEAGLTVGGDFSEPHRTISH